MLHLITTLLFLLQTTTSGTRAQLIFKRQIFGFDTSGRQLEANIDNNEDNSEEFLNLGILFVHINITVLWLVMMEDFNIWYPDIAKSYQPSPSPLTKKKRDNEHSTLSGFSLESDEPFVPILSSRTAALSLREQARSRQKAQLEQALARQQEMMRRFRNNFSRLPGPVSITLETPSATVPLAPRLGKI